MKWRMSRLVAGLAAAGLATPAAADPVSLSALIATMLQGTAYAWVGYTLLATAIVYGAADASKKRRKARAAAKALHNANLEDRSVTTLTAAPYWRIVYGRCIVGGAVINILTSDKTAYDENSATYTKPDALKHLVIEVAHHECEAIHEVYIDGEPVGTLDGSGNATTGAFFRTRTDSAQASIAPGAFVDVPRPVVSVISASLQNGEGLDTSWVDGSGAYTLTLGNTRITNTGSTNLTINYTVQANLPSVRIQKHLGSDSQTVDSYLNGLFPTDWDTTCRLRGVTYVVITLDLEDTRFQGGPPNFTFDVSGRKVYDPRTTTTAFSRNVALCIRDFLTAEWGYKVATADINDATTIAAANACDVLIDLTVDGVTQANQPKYTLNGSFLTSDSREAVLDEMADAMAGGVTEAGLWVMWAGAWTATVMDLTDDDLAGSISLPRTDTDYEELYNGVRGLYIPAGRSTPVEFDPYQNSVFVAADGEELWESKDLPFTDNRARARNICRILVEGNRAGQVLNYPAKLKAWPLQPGIDRVRVTSAEYGFTLKYFRVLDWQFAINGAVNLTLKEDAPEIYDEADAASADPQPNTTLPSPWVVGAVSGVGVTSEVRLTSDGGYLPLVTVSWTRPNDAYITNSGHIIVAWRRVDQTRWQTIEVPGDQSSVPFSGPRDRDRIVVEVYARNSQRQPGPSTFASHTVASLPDDAMPFPIVMHGVASALSAYRGTIVKVGSTTAWDAGAYSSKGIVGASVLSFTVPQTNRNVVVGLNSDPTTDASYTSIDYAVAFDASGNVLVYENGTSYAAGTYAAGARCRIVYDEVAVRYYIDSVLVRLVAAPPSLALSMDSSFYQKGARIEDLNFTTTTPAARGNMIDTSTWIAGLTGTVGVRGGSLFSRSGEVSESTIVLATAPDGALREVWQASSVDVVGGAGDADGGWVGGSVPIDYRRQYRLVVFFKNTAFSGAPGAIYLGTNSHTVSSVVKTIAGADETNPYFIGGPTRSAFPLNRWHMAVGYIMPSSYGTTALNLSGIYDLATGQKVYNGVDFKWRGPEAADAHLRTFIYYSDAGNVTQFWGPRFELCDGTEPSIDALIAMAKQSNAGVSAVDWANSVGLNGQFTNWAAAAAAPDGWGLWAGADAIKETTITRTGPNAVRYNVASGEAGSFFTWTPSQPLALGAYFRIALDMYIVANTSGNKPGMLVRLFTDAGFTTYHDTVINPASMATGFWQTLSANASVRPNEQIYRAIFYLMGSWKSMPGGGAWVGQVVFDSLLVDLMAPTDTDHIRPGATVSVSSYTGSAAAEGSSSLSQAFSVPAGAAYLKLTLHYTLTGTAGGSAGFGRAYQDFVATPPSGGSVNDTRLKRMALPAGQTGYMPGTAIIVVPNPVAGNWTVGYFSDGTTGDDFPLDVVDSTVEVEILKA